MTKHIIHPDGTKRFFGRDKSRLKIHRPILRLKNYLARALPNPPVLWDWRRLAVASLEQMYLNDSEGDCVIAELAHAIGVITGNSSNGLPLILTDNQINLLYSAIGNYVPGDPSTDNGCDIQTALNYWGVSGLLPDGSHKISGYLAVNPSDKFEIQLAIFLFENLSIGLDLPDSWISPFPSSNNFIWDVQGQPDPSNGHNILGFGYNLQGVNVSTWALEGLMTYSAIANYCSVANQGELYTVISPDSIIKATSRAPNGFDWTQLMSDFQAIKA
jgi:hypothetical protein